MKDTRSLYWRLMLLYTGAGFIVLATVSMIVVTAIFAYAQRPLAQDLATAVHAVEDGGAAPASEPTGEVARRIAARESRRGIVAIAIPADVSPQQAPGLPSGEISIAALFGLSPAFVRLHDTSVVIFPDRNNADRIFALFYFVVASTLVLALWIAWLGATLATRETLKPLLTVTAELERFASGDFTPRPQKVPDRTEFGALAAAYNGAAGKVTEAFLERRRVEEQIRQFVAEAGHELRTPLTVVAGYVDVLRRGGFEDLAMRGAAFASLNTEVKRMRTLVERLMTLARLDRILEAEPEVVDVGSIVKQAVDAFAVINDTPIVLDAAPDLFVVGEPVDLYEAVANLIENALKYGDRTPVTVTVQTSGDRIAVHVRDAGRGIAEPDRLRIFERFYRGSDRGETTGSGLGLAIAAKAAERLGGQLELEDGRAGSTTFVLAMPKLEGISRGTQLTATAPKPLPVAQAES